MWRLALVATFLSLRVLKWLRTIQCFSVPKRALPFVVARAWHLASGRAGLHSLNHLFMLPSLDTPLDAGGAVRLYSAAGATGHCIAMERQPMFEAGEVPGQG